MSRSAALTEAHLLFAKEGCCKRCVSGNIRSMPPTDQIERLRQIAEAQWGLVTTAQAERHRVGRVALSRLAATGVLERLAHGLYRVRGGAAVPFLDMRGMWLLLDPALLAEERMSSPNAVISHRSAARLLDLGDLPDEPFEFTVRERKQSRNRHVRFHRAVLAPADWTIVDGLPVTVARRVVTDLLADREDGSHVASIVADALRRRLVDAGELSDAMTPYAHAYGLSPGDGAGLLDYLLDMVGASPRQIADHVDQVLATHPPSVAGAVAGLSVAAQALRASVPAEMLGAVKAIQEAAAMSDAVRSMVDQPEVRKAMTLQAEMLRQAIDNPVIRALQRDAGLRARLAEQAALARRLARVVPR